MLRTPAFFPHSALRSQHPETPSMYEMTVGSFFQRRIKIYRKSKKYILYYDQNMQIDTNKQM